MAPGILFCGDPHGHWAQIHDAVGRLQPATVILLGDYDLDRPLDAVMAPATAVGSEVYWIAGNHEGDRDEWYDHAFNSTLADRNLNAQVVTVADGSAACRLAGLGGVFRYKIWHPDREPVWSTRASFLDALPAAERWRCGLPRRHRVTIWHEDYLRLADQRADVLVCHEAPPTVRRRGRPLGWAVIGRLAEAMGVTRIFHGHYHAHYTARLPNGIAVHGVGLGAIVDENGATVAAPVRSARTL